MTLFESVVPARDRTPGPARPSVSPLVWAAVALWAGSVAGSAACWSGYLGGPARAMGWVGVAVAGIAGLASLGLSRGRRSFLGGCSLALALGLATALMHGSWVLEQGRLAEAAGPCDWTGVVIADPREGMSGLRVAVALREGPASGRFVIDWPEGCPSPLYGQRVVFSARMRALTKDAAWSRDAFLRGEAGGARLWRARALGWEPGLIGVAGALRARCLSLLDRAGGPGAAVAGSAAFGRRDTQHEDAFRAIGVAHLMTASGIHLALVAALSAWALRLANLRRPLPALGSVAAAAAFCLASGLRLSVVRAAIVTCLSLVSALGGRRRSAIGGAAIGAMALVAMDPPAAGDVALWIGMSAAAGIALFGGLAGRWVGVLLPRRSRRLARTVAATVAVQLSIAPLAATLFGVFTPLAPLSTVLIAPFVEAAVVLCVLGAASLPVWAPLGQGLLGMSTVPAGFAAQLAGRLAATGVTALPVEGLGPLVAGFWVSVGVVLWLRWPRPRRVWRVRAGASLISAALALALLVPQGSGPRIVVLDVGQGDAILVQDGASAMLVDCGPDELTLRRALARSGVRRLDCLVLTHAHEDHTGGVSGLVGAVRVGWVGVPDVPDAFPAEATGEVMNAAAGATLERLRAGMSWSVGSWKVSVLWPAGGERRLETNDTSVVLLAQRAGVSVLLLGDAESRAQEGAARRLERRVDVVKVAHHGSVNGTLESLIGVWRPSAALISVGAGNRFGHPHAQALRVLAGAGVSVRRTDQEGDLTVRASGDGWQIASAGRGPRLAACATIDAASRPCLTAGDVHPSQERVGYRGPVRSQARLPDPRLRGAAAGARGPPPARPARQGGGPGLQHGDVRGRRRVGRGRGQRCQHDALHVR